MAVFQKGGTIGLVNARYLWESAGHSTFQGSTFVVGFTIARPNTRRSWLAHFFFFKKKKKKLLQEKGSGSAYQYHQRPARIATPDRVEIAPGHAQFHRRGTG